MKKILVFLIGILFSVQAFSQVNDTIKNLTLDEVTVTSMYRSNTTDMDELKADVINHINVGQEPSHMFKTMPSIYARSDNGTEFGYGYYYIRGLDQTRINVTLDGMPWNEGEDFGTYFANSPDLMASMHSAKVERGTSSKTNGVSAAAGNVNLESVNLRQDTISYVQGMYGVDNTYKASIVYNMGLKKGFGLHLKATTSHTDGYRRNSWNNSHAFTAKFGYYFNDRHSIDVLSINGYHSNCQGWIGSTKAELDDDARANGNTKDETDNWLQTVNKIQYNGWLTDNTLLSASVYLQYQTGSYRFDHDNYCYHAMLATPYTDDDGVYHPYGDWAVNPGTIYDYGLTHYLYGGNVVARSTVGVFDIYGGVNAYGFQREHFMDERNKSHWKNVHDSEYYDNIGYKTDINVFAGTTAHLGNWTLGANLQYRHVDFSYTDKMNNVHLSSDDMKTNWNFVNGGIDITYNINKNHHVYAKLAVSNREPMRSDMFDGNERIYPDSSGDIKFTNELKSELVHDVELGWEGKGSIFKANVNLYYMHFKNELILNGNLGSNGLPGHINADNSFRTGAELSFDVEPVKGLHLVNSTSYAYGKVNKANVCNNATHIFFPAWTLYQDIHYDTKVGDVAVIVGANYDLRSKIYLDLDNQYSLPTNMALNVYGSLTFRDRIELSLHLNNITNHVNYSYGTVNGNGDILYVQESKFNCLGSVKFYF